MICRRGGAPDGVDPMQESLNQAVMIVMAGFAARLLHPDTQRHGRLLLAGLVVLAVASVLRPTNWIVAVPLVLVAMPRHRPLSVALATLGAALGIPVFWLAWRYLSAPIPGLAIDWAPATGSGFIEMIATYFFTHLRDNIDDVFDLAEFLDAPFYQQSGADMAIAIAAAVGAVIAQPPRSIQDPFPGFERQHCPGRLQRYLHQSIPN